MIFTLIEGFSASGGLIIAIGAQNAFVLRQGLRGQHLFLTALLCSIIDATLILAGVIGFGYFLSNYPDLIVLSKYFAMTFLVAYGCVAMKSAFNPMVMHKRPHEEVSSSLTRTVLLLLGFSLLNPHVYLDTVILLGSIAAQHADHHRGYFALGAMSASFAWFFGITYGARLLGPFLQKRYAWRIIDSLIALTMWGIALALAAGM